MITYVERNNLVPEREEPFANLPAQYLRVAMDGFNANFRPLIVGVLMQFKPYREFIEQVKKRGGIDGDLAFYLVLPKKAQEQTKKDLGEAAMSKKIDEPLEALAKLKTADWPFFAVFQKGLMRASAIAWRHFAVLGGSKTSTIEDFLKKWVVFLDELWDRGLLAVKAPFPKRKELIWAGISLNPASETVRWSESAVQRIAGILLLWWYFYANEKSQVGSFLKKVRSPRGNEEFPKAKEMAHAVAKALKPIVKGPEEEPDENEIEKRVRKRLRDLIILAINKAAPAAEDISEEEEDNDEGVALLEGQAETTPEGGEAAGEEGK